MEMCFKSVHPANVRYWIARFQNALEYVTIERMRKTSTELNVDVQLAEKVPQTQFLSVSEKRKKKINTEKKKDEFVLIVYHKNQI